MVKFQSENTAQEFWELYDSQIERLTTFQLPGVGLFLKQLLFDNFTSQRQWNLRKVSEKI